MTILVTGPFPGYSENPYLNDCHEKHGPPLNNHINGDFPCTLYSVQPSEPYAMSTLDLEHGSAGRRFDCITLAPSYP